MKIAIIGTGYVGLPTAAGFAHYGFDVVCVDKIEQKITDLQQGVIPIYEPGLSDLVLEGVANNKLKFTTNLPEAVKDAEVVILAVGTPTDEKTGHADMTYIKQAAKEVGKNLEGYTVIATKSTVPVGTGTMIEGIIKEENPELEFDCVSLPEFLKEGKAVEDFFEPDRVVVGVESEKAKDVMAHLYKSFEEKNVPILYCRRNSAEMIKYASNCFLGIKISYINEVSSLCEKLDANIDEVAQGIGMDTRIGNKFLQTGPGFGGSCFPKDMLEFIKTSQKSEAELSLVTQALKINEDRKQMLADRALNIVKDVNDIAVLGLAFKAETDDSRYSPSFKMVSTLLDGDKNVKAYDKKAIGTFSATLNDDRVQYCDDMYECIKGKNAIVIMTEWDEFINIDLTKVKDLMNGNIIIDFRNLLDRQEVESYGFEYHCLGK